MLSRRLRGYIAVAMMVLLSVPAAVRAADSSAADETAAGEPQASATLVPAVKVAPSKRSTAGAVPSTPAQPRVSAPKPVSIAGAAGSLPAEVVPASAPPRTMPTRGNVMPAVRQASNVQAPTPANQNAVPSAGPVLSGPPAPLPPGQDGETLMSPPAEYSGQPSGGPGPMSGVVNNGAQQDWFYVRGEYLYWWTKGMQIPALVSTGPSAAQPGFLGSPGTTVLFGGNGVDSNGNSGGRLTIGAWLEDTQRLGVEGDYFALGTVSTHFSASGDANGNPIISRPFYDVRVNGTGQVIGPNVELVSSPGSITGTVLADTYTGLIGAGGRLRINLCCSQGCYNDFCVPGMNGWGRNRVDFLVGYRYLQLRDGVAVNEFLDSTINPNPALQGTFHVNDTFQTSNQFNGVDLGTSVQRYRGRWSLEMLTKMALGSNYQVVDINGYTVATPAGGAAMLGQGGLLAQSSNIGHYTRNQFCVVPELNLNLGYRLTPRLRAIFGYTFLYWSAVSRAGDQIDPNVNSTLLPFSGNPQTGDLRYPHFPFQTTDFWAQGMNVGLDYRW